MTKPILLIPTDKPTHTPAPLQRYPQWHVFISLMGIIALVLFGGCSFPSSSVVTGSGNSTTEMRSVHGFTRIKATITGDLTIIQGNTESLQVTADDNLLSSITTNVVNGTVEIDMKRGTTLRPKSSISFVLTAKNLDTIEIHGTGNVTAPTFQAPSLTVIATGTGGVSMSQLTVTNLTLTLTGTGSATLGGSATSQTVAMTGTGGYHGDALVTQSTVIGLDGIGSAVVNATQTLKVTLTGIGSLEYIGNPVITQTVTGLGSVKQHS